VIDSDVFLRKSAVQAAVETALRTGKITWPHTRWRGISELWAKRVIDDGHDFGPEIDHDDMDVLVERTNALSWSCCIVIPRAAWDRLGGFDQRFRGWGYEDMAFQSAVVGLLGFERLPAEGNERGWADVYHLWHPRSEERIQQGSPATTASRDYITNGRLGRRYMVALRRDHAKHDRIAPWLPGEIERDIENLRNDERKFEILAKRAGLEDWSAWWPSLEELVEGAKRARARDVPEVALILRTGGEDDVWPERSTYLRQSLASLAERVTGPIQRRVIFSDWSERFTAELEEIAREHGFYVVGGGHRGYIASVRRLWRYIDVRVREPFLCLVEDDFLYLRDVDLTPMIETLVVTPRVQQIALLRDACYESERERGGILGWPEDQFTAVDQANPRRARLEHRLFWTMNPSVFSRAIVRTNWPVADSSERVFGNLLLRDARVRFAFWGTGEPWIEHIGETRASDVY
jgi:N-terminal domain of galactosyltransferase